MYLRAQESYRPNFENSSERGYYRKCYEIIIIKSDCRAWQTRQARCNFHLRHFSMFNRSRIYCWSDQGAVCLIRWTEFRSPHTNDFKHPVIQSFPARGRVNVEERSWRENKLKSFATQSSARKDISVSKFFADQNFNVMRASRIRLKYS